MVKRIEELEKAVLILADRVQKLEMLKGSQVKEADYQPMFTRWPEVNGR